MEQAVLERGVLDLHEVASWKLALEGARRDASIEHFAGLAVFVGGFLALDRQGVFLGDDRDFICEKPETATEIRKLFSPVRSML